MVKCLNYESNLRGGTLTKILKSKKGKIITIPYKEKGKCKNLKIKIIEK